MFDVGKFLTRHHSQTVIEDNAQRKFNRATACDRNRHFASANGTSVDKQSVGGVDLLLHGWIQFDKKAQRYYVLWQVGLSEGSRYDLKEFRVRVKAWVMR